MKKALLYFAVLIVGLLLFCPKVYACDELPKAGFEDYMAKIEPADIIMPTYILSDKEADLLLRLGVLEGGEDNTEGIANTMQVVLNRVKSEEFPNTIEEVIFQKNPIQFCTASRLAVANITPQAYQALDAVIFNDYNWNEALYFESLPGKVWGNAHDYLFSYGGQDFYK